MSNTESTKRIPAIEAFRFLSIIQICIWHFSVPCIDAGFLGVEFFFVLTGFFMYRDATKRHALGITDYSIKKMSKFLCKHILAVWGGVFDFYAKRYPGLLFGLATYFTASYWTNTDDSGIRYF